MAFWSVTGGEPKRSYRWVIEFLANSNLNGLSYALKKCDKPKAKIGSATHTYLNHKFHYPGRLEWEDINMTIASISSPDDATVKLYNTLIGAGYGVPRDPPVVGTSNVSTLGKAKFNTVLGSTLNLIQVDSNGKAIEKWVINNPFFTSVNFGTLDYASEEIVEITCVMKYDWAQLSTSSPVQAPSDAVIPPVNPGFPTQS